MIIMFRTKNSARDVFLLKQPAKNTKKITKKTSMKNLYCAENKSTRMLLMIRDTQIKVLILFFLMMAKTINRRRLTIKSILIFDLMPSKRNQFLI
jgi:hypothetical protein